MTRAEAIEKFRADPGSFNIDELHSMHVMLDEGIRDTRKVQAEISEEIGARERAAASAQRSDPRLTQRLGRG